MKRIAAFFISIYRDGDEVAVVYLRHGYTSENYTSQKVGFRQSIAE